MEPILPQQEKGILRFTNPTPPPAYSIGITSRLESMGHGFLSHREQLKLLKIEKAKAKNFRDQHSWKLKT